MSNSRLPIIFEDSKSSCIDDCTDVNRTSNIPITKNLAELLNPGLHKKEPIFSAPLRPLEEGEKVYSLTEQELNNIRERRGAVVDLHPGMGGVSPSVLRGMIDSGVQITSLDYMLTQGCNFECTWCFANSSPYAGDVYLPFDKLSSITKDAADIGVELFILTGGEPLVYKDRALGKQNGAGDHFFRVVEMIKDTYSRINKSAKILTFDDVALITPEIANRFAENKVGLCTKGDTLHEELQDYKVNQRGAFRKMEQGYKNLVAVGYGSNPELRLVVNSVLDHTTFDGMVDLHFWVMERGFDHSIVPVHYCGNAQEEDQEAGIHSPHVKVLYDLIARIDKDKFGVDWKPWSAFTYDKTCNRNMSGLHIKANGDVTACSESPGKDETDKYTFGNIMADVNFSLKELARSEKLSNYRSEFSAGIGEYVCSPKICDLNAHDLCRGGCATRSAYSLVDRETGLIVKNSDPHRYSQFREDPLCPAWTVLAQKQGILRHGLLEEIYDRLINKSSRIETRDFPYIKP